MLIEHFPNVVDAGFTARMEDELDEVASGERPWPPVVREFYDPLKEALEAAADAPRVEQETDEKLREVRQADDRALGPLRPVPRLHRLPRVQEHAPARRGRRRSPQPTDEKCDVCQSPMVVKRGRFGQFLACSRYPECKGTRPLLKKVGVACPKDGGEIVEKRSKQGPHLLLLRQLPELRLHELVAPADDSPARRAAASSSRRRKGTAKCTAVRLEGRHRRRPLSRNWRKPRRDRPPRTRDRRMTAAGPDDAAAPRAVSVARSLAAASCGDGCRRRRSAAAVLRPRLRRRRRRPDVAGTPSRRPQTRRQSTPTPRGGTLRSYNFDADPSRLARPAPDADRPDREHALGGLPRLLRYDDEVAGDDRARPGRGDAGAARRHDLRLPPSRRRPLPRRAEVPRRVPRHGRPPPHRRRREAQHRAAAQPQQPAGRALLPPRRLERHRYGIEVPDARTLHHPHAASRSRRCSTFLAGRHAFIIAARGRRPGATRSTTTATR